MTDPTLYNSSLETPPPPSRLRVPDAPRKLVLFRRVILGLSLVPAFFLSTGCSIWKELEDQCDPLEDFYYFSLGVFIPGTLLNLFRVLRPASRISKVNQTGIAWLSIVLYLAMLGCNAYLFRVWKSSYPHRGIVTLSFMILSALAVVEAGWCILLFRRFEASEEYRQWKVLYGVPVKETELEKSLKGMEEGRKNDQKRLETAMKLIQLQQKQIQQLLAQGDLPSYGQSGIVAAGSSGPVGGSLTEIGHKHEI